MVRNWYKKSDDSVLTTANNVLASVPPNEREAAKEGIKFKDVLKNSAPIVKAYAYELDGTDKKLTEVQSSAKGAGGFFESLGNSILNAGVAMLASLAVEGLIQLIDAAVVTKDELREAAAASAKDYEDLTNEVVSLNNELDANKTRIEELNKLKSTADWTPVLQNELSTLQEQNVELEKKLEYKERLAIIAGNESNKDARAALYDKGNEFSNHDMHEHGLGSIVADYQADDFEASDIFSKIIKQESDKLDKLREEQSGYLFGSGQWEQYEKKIEDQSKVIDGYTGRYKALFDAMETTMDGVTDPSLITSWDKVVGQYTHAMELAQTSQLAEPILDFNSQKKALLDTLVRVRDVTDSAGNGISKSKYNLLIKPTLDQLQTVETALAELDDTEINILLNLEGFDPNHPESWGDSIKQAEKLAARTGGYNRFKAESRMQRMDDPRANAYYAQWMEGLTEKDWAIIYDIVPADGSMSVADAKQAFDELQQAAEAASKPIVVDSLDTAKSSVDQYSARVTALNTALQQQATDGYLSAASLKALTEAGVQLGDALEYTGKGYTLNGDALRDQMDASQAATLAWVDLRKAQLEANLAQIRDIPTIPYNAKCKNITLPST